MTKDFEFKADENCEMSDILSPDVLRDLEMLDKLLHERDSSRQNLDGKSLKSLNSHQNI
jgi:hypothetical protein